MRLWVFSDLHLDVNSSFPFELPAPFPAHDVVVIAGDLCEDMARGVRWIADSGLNGRPVLYVGGNHEFYGHDRLSNLRAARDCAAGYPNIHVLECDHVDIDGVTFLGATLWTDYALYGDVADAMSVAERMMFDHRMIRVGQRAFAAADALGEHRSSRSWLSDQLAVVRSSPVVVVSHHAPDRQSVPPRFRDNRLSPAFASDLGSLVERADLWVHGHTHMTGDYRRGRCRVVNNPRGYVRREQTGFDPRLIVEV